MTANATSLLFAADRLRPPLVNIRGGVGGGGTERSFREKGGQGAKEHPERGNL